MYTIYRGLDGKFHCQGRLQDGTERWVKDTLDQAVKSMRQFAEFMNGTKINKKKDITYLEPKNLPPCGEYFYPFWVEYYPFGKKKAK